MDVEEIENVSLVYLNIKDYEELRSVMEQAYPNMSAYWKESQIQKLLQIFPEGQVAMKIDGKLAGCALSIIVDLNDFEDSHTYKEIIANGTFNSHRKDGDTLYGIEVFIKPEYRGLRLGRRLYDYRKELCEKLNLKGIAFGGRIPNYHKYADELTPKEYIAKVKNKEIHDPVLDFQLSNDFYPTRVLKNYLEGDNLSKEYAILLEWRNVYYQKPSKKAASQKSVVRIGLVQWQMRLYQDVDAFLNQSEYFVGSLANYHCDFAVFPEFFNAPLLGNYNHLPEAEAIRALAEHTDRIVEVFSGYAISYNVNVIVGSMPRMADGDLYNTGYLCRRDGTIDEYEKIHITPSEVQSWGLKGGNKVKVLDTDCGKIGVLICYDVEFPELSRILAQQGMDILFVPFWTDTQNGFSRVKLCAQARAVENECYVAITGSVGNLPKVHNMDTQFSQSMVFTPCDFPFPDTGVKSEATPNTEMILVSDVDLDLLKELHEFGSVQNLKDRRTDLYEVVNKKVR